jgi:hypothetical protein
MVEAVIEEADQYADERQREQDGDAMTIGKLYRL